MGWTDGRNLRIDYRWSAGNPERMQTLAKELTALQPDVLFSRSTPVTGALMKQTRTIPIVFAVVSDPVGEGFVVSLARPGGNATGFTNAESSLTGKWLGLLKEIMPSINRVAFIFDPKVAPGGGTYYTKLIESAAPSFSVVPTAAPVHRLASNNGSERSARRGCATAIAVCMSCSAVKVARSKQDAAHLSRVRPAIAQQDAQAPGQGEAA